MVTVEAQKPDPEKNLLQKRLQVLNGILQNMISDTNYTSFDLYTTLCKHKGQSFRVPTDLACDGLPLLHACVIKARYTFLTILFYLGWFPLLIRQKVDISPGVLDLSIFVKA